MVIFRVNFSSYTQLMASESLLYQGACEALRHLVEEGLLTEDLYVRHSQVMHDKYFQTTSEASSGTEEVNSQSSQQGQEKPQDLKDTEDPSVQDGPPLDSEKEALPSSVASTTESDAVSDQEKRPSRFVVRKPGVLHLKTGMP